MTIKCTATGMVLSKNENPAKNGTVYYSLLVFQENDAMKVSCTPEVAKQVEPGQKYIFDAEYSEDIWDGKVYHRFKLVDVVPFEDVKKAASKQA